MRTVRRVAGAAMVVAAACVLAACGSQIEGSAVPDADALTTSTPPPVVPTTGATQTPDESSFDLSIDVEPGDCIRLGGTVEEATAEKATCGSMESNYKVIEIASSYEDCVGDADQWFSELYAGVSRGALCLDIDWVVGDCIDIGGEDPERIDCGAPGIEPEQVTEILTGTSDVNDCSISAGGFVYEVRNFVVCTDSL